VINTSNSFTQGHMIKHPHATYAMLYIPYYYIT